MSNHEHSSTVAVDREACDICGTCVAVCPTAALKIIRELEIDHDRCIRCYRCIRICPFGALKRDNGAAEHVSG